MVGHGVFIGGVGAGRRTYEVARGSGVRLASTSLYQLHSSIVPEKTHSQVRKNTFMNKNINNHQESISMD
jgi:hypothetical protein